MGICFGRLPTPPSWGYISGVAVALKERGRPAAPRAAGGHPGPRPPPRDRRARCWFRGVQGHCLGGELGRCGAAKRCCTKIMVTPAMRRALAAAVAGLFLIAAAVLASAQDVKPELSRVRLAVGGKPALFYPPLAFT